jgi:hypothetical protein
MISNGKVAKEDEICVRVFLDQLDCEVAELNIQIDWLH